MPPKCYICKYYDPKKMKLFRIPDRNDDYSERSGLWLKLLNEKTENIHKIRVCSEHFLNKKPAKSADILDIDWIPNKNLGLFSKNQKKVEQSFRDKKKEVEQNLERLTILSSFKDQPSTSNNNSNDVISASNVNYGNNNLNVAGHSNHEIENIYNTTDSVAKPTANKEALENISDQVNSTKNVPILCNYQAANNSFFKNKQVNSNKKKQFLDDVVSFIEVPEQINENTIECIQAIANSTTNTKEGLVIPPKKRKIDVIRQKFFFPKDIQTDLTMSDIDLLFKYYQEAVEERKELLLKISTLVIDVDFFKNNDKKTRFYTGLTTWTLLKNFFDMIKNFLPTHFNCKLSPFQMVALTLMKLRLNLSFTDLGYRFQVDGSTVARYFYRCIYILYKLFYNSKLLHWPERSNLYLNTPSYFRSAFKDAITIIIDCFELFIERSSLLLANAQAFSTYKHHLTLKYLIGISTSGMIIFISEAFGGRASDKFATLKSRLLDYLEEGDIVLADKGFKIGQEVEAKNASLAMPSFVKKGNQLHPIEVEQSRFYSSVRIHVEREIAVLRQKFNICSDRAEMSAISKDDELFQCNLYDKIVYICCCLVNICPSAVSNDFEM